MGDVPQNEIVIFQGNLQRWYFWQCRQAAIIDCWLPNLKSESIATHCLRVVAVTQCTSNVSTNIAWVFFSLENVSESIQLLTSNSNLT